MFRKTSLLLHKALFLELAFLFYNNFTTFNVCNNTNPLNNNTIWFKGIKPTVKYLNIIPHNAQGLFFMIIPLLFLYTVLKMYFCCVLYTIPT